MKISPTEVFGENWEGRKKSKEKEGEAQTRVEGGLQGTPPLMGWDGNVTEEASL